MLATERLARHLVYNGAFELPVAELEAAVVDLTNAFQAAWIEMHGRLMVDEADVGTSSRRPG